MRPVVAQIAWKGILMNKVITDGLVLMPPSFANGLDVWSSGDGTPGSDTYAGSGNGVYVPADQDFGAALELLKTSATQRVRYMGETPILPGCYLKVTVRVKAISGNLPSVRISTRPSRADNGAVGTVTNLGVSVPLTTYGEVVEVSAFVGSGNRTVVDMVWGDQVVYAHMGLDLTGANNGVVRIDDIEIEDVTSVFLRNMISTVDVRDFGAVGDGVTDDSAAFEAADQAANGREVLVSAGTYFLGSNVTINNRIQFEGTVVMAAEHRLALIKNFDLPTYYDAFDDEERAFKAAFHALLFFSNHESLDLGGRRVALSELFDMQAAVLSRTTFATRRVIRNGQLHPIDGPAWDPEIVTSQATYDPANARVLTGVANVANIQMGSLVEGNGVGREIYVSSVDVGQQRVTLSQPHL